MALRMPLEATVDWLEDSEAPMRRILAAPLLVQKMLLLRITLAIDPVALRLAFRRRSFSLT